jgi:hypothetical protein
VIYIEIEFMLRHMALRQVDKVQIVNPHAACKFVFAKVFSIECVLYRN